MSRGDDKDNLDKVFKALGNLTRRKILRLLAQRPRYPYELSKVLNLTGRGVQKHLAILEEAGMVESAREKSDLGPDRVYYKLKVSFGLSTTISPNAFAVRFTRTFHQISFTPPPGFRVPPATADVKAVRRLLRDLEKVNKHLDNLDNERMRYSHLRGQIINRIEELMEQWHWDEESCKKVRALINPVRSEVPQKSPPDDQHPSSVHEALRLFEEDRRDKKSQSDEEETEIPID